MSSPVNLLRTFFYQNRSDFLEVNTFHSGIDTTHPTLGSLIRVSPPLIFLKKFSTTPAPPPPDSYQDPSPVY